MSAFFKISINKKYKVIALLITFIAIPHPAGAQVFCDTLINKGVRLMQQENYGKSIELLLQAKDIAERGRYYRQKFLANNIIGADYFAIMDYGAALKYYLEASKIANTHLDKSSRITALNNIAILYSKDKKYSKALDYFQQAYVYAASQNDRLHMGLYSLNMGLVNYDMGDYTKAKRHIAFSLKNLKDINNLMLAELTMARINLAQGKVKSARDGVLKILRQTESFTATNDMVINTKLVLAATYIEENTFKQGIEILQKLEGEVDNPEMRSERFRLLSNLYQRKKMFNDAIRYRDSLLINEQKIYQLRSENAYYYNKLRFEIEDYKNKTQAREKELRAQRRFFLLIVLILIFSMGTLALLSKIRLQKKKLLAEQKEKDILRELAKEKDANLILEKEIQEQEVRTVREKEQLKLAVESKTKELSIKAWSLSKRNELIEEIISTFIKIPELKKNRLFLDYLRRLREEVDSGEEWNEFVRHFNELNYDFVKKLKERHANLSNNDVRFLIYLYVNLSAKEIANLLGITTESARKRKERIAMKMGLDSSRALYDYLISI